MKTGQKFAAGIALLGNAIVGACFYNSSGENAFFTLDRRLTDSEQSTLTAFGFAEYREGRPSEWGGRGFAEISFRQWSDT